LRSVQFAGHHAVSGSAPLILGSLAKVSAADLTGPALDAYRTAESGAIVKAIGLAVALAMVAAVVCSAIACRLKSTTIRRLAGLDLLKRPRFGFGALCIFLYVGAEVSIGSLIVNYLRQAHVMGLEEAAGKLISVYWGGAMVGRFIGSAVLRKVAPGKALAFNAILAIALIALSTHTNGVVSGYSLLAIGLMNSIMFPTIFSLACEKLGARGRWFGHHQRGDLRRGPAAADRRRG
jgi:FHS family L-fucose permease-like MFS transporter